MVLSREEKEKMVLDLYYTKGYTYKQLTKEKSSRRSNNNNNNTNSSSPYSELIRNRIAGFKLRFESGSSPTEVAKIILKCVTSETPHLRYLVGDGAFKLMDIKKNTSDKDFRKLVMDSVLQYQQQP